MDIYVVRPGDTVGGIASYYGINVSQIIYDNQLVYPYALAVGQALFIVRLKRVLEAEFLKRETEL